MKIHSLERCRANHMLKLLDWKQGQPDTPEQKQRITNLPCDDMFHINII
jgi:hypothetical protein